MLILNKTINFHVSHYCVHNIKVIAVFSFLNDFTVSNKHSFYVKIMLNKRTILGRTSFGRLIARETFSNPLLKQGLLRKNCLFTFAI